MSSGKKFPNPKTIHTFCIPPNCSGIQKFRLNIADPTLNDIFTALTDNRRDNQGNHIKPAHRADKFVKEDDSLDPKLPHVVSCDISCLDDIEFLLLSEDSPCMASARSALLDPPSLPDPGLYSEVKEALVGVIVWLGANFDMLMASFPSCVGETLDLYAIFDDKLPIIWGRSIEGDSSPDIVFERLPFRFPLQFEKFAIGLYSRTNDVFYSPVEYSYIT